MSGGLDSSVAAALLVEQGHEVIGLTAHLWKDGSRCCSAEDVARAARVARRLGIEHRVLNSVEFFGEKVVRPFVEEYARGLTPSPCVRCNEFVKFGVLLRDALRMGCARLATGHYARAERRDSVWRLLRGADERKDQSYFLHRLDQAQLAHALFPLGTWTKAGAAAYAARCGLPVETASDSQDLCFVPAAGYAVFVEKYRPDLRAEGRILDTAGREVGRHAGVHRFTVGQREGLGIASASRLYVKELRPESNEVIVGTREEVARSSCTARDVRWVAGAPPAGAVRCVVRLRYRHRGAAATVDPLAGDRAEVRFDQPEFAVTPGQAAVFYDADEVLGGGWIERGERGPEGARAGGA